MTVVRARETVGSQVVQQTRIHRFIYKEFSHFAKECTKSKRVKDYTHHKKKMLLCKQAEKGVPLQAEQANWLDDTDDEIDEQELGAHYSYMEKIQEVPIADSGTDTEPLEKVQYDAEYNVFVNARQHSEQPESISNTCVVEKVNSIVIPNSPDMCNNDIQTDQNAKECDDKRKSVETKFDKPSVVRQPNAQRIPKSSVLGKPTPFLDSFERKSFSKAKSVPKTNELEGLSKAVTTQIFPQKARQDVRNTNVIKPGRVCYVEGLNHKLFSVSQFYDADLEVAFRKSTCSVRDLQGNDLLNGTSVGIKSLLDAVGITAAHVCVNAAQLELVLLGNFNENI
nr:integrase, catalytic region, zinc finger, CCHC-type, peptidase aspartic, catalytic [Tanacetum cinerariifolium]